MYYPSILPCLQNMQRSPGIDTGLPWTPAEPAPRATTFAAVRIVLLILRERFYAYGLSGYLQHDFDASKAGLQNGPDPLDCLWGELYGSIHIAEISEGVITAEHADYLRQKYLWGSKAWLCQNTKQALTTAEKYD